MFVFGGRVIALVVYQDEVSSEIRTLAREQDEPISIMGEEFDRYKNAQKKVKDIVQKAVELGVFQITPILTGRCIAKINEKNLEKKLQRLQKISKQAAAQSGRGVVPVVNSILKFDVALEKLAFGANKHASGTDIVSGPRKNRAQ